VIRVTARIFLGQRPSKIEAAVSGIRESWHRLLAEAALFGRDSWVELMNIDRRYRTRQHASADVAPELYDAEEDDR
jgi:hypothetical protein